MTLFKKPYKIPDGYSRLSDNYSESPFGHYEGATDTQKEEYFMQYMYPIKLNRLALRTPVGFRLIYQYAKDLWNNRVGITIPDEKDLTEEKNKLIFSHLMKLNWYQEMEKLSAFEREQGEAILLCYYGDEGDIKKYKDPINRFKSILKVEAFSPLRYSIPAFDKYGKPAYYRIQVKSPNGWRSMETVKVHPSRVIRKCANTLEFRFTGYSDLAAVSDPIIVLSTILKATGEAAFRWGTGHPVFFTKNIVDQSDLTKLKDALGDVTRRSWHAVPIDKIEKIEMLGQAGSMLNLKSLADICFDQIVVGCGIPKPILLGEISGIMGSEVSERGYFAKLDRDHTDLEFFVRTYFKRDINLKRILRGIKFFELDWGIREVFNKMDQVEYEQKRVANALAMTQICSINESRHYLDLPPLPDEDGGDVVLGLLPYYELEWSMTLQMATLQQQGEEGGEGDKVHGEPQTNTSMNQKSRSTEKKAASQKDLEKDKSIKPITRDATVNMTKGLRIDKLKEKLKDSIKELRKDYSINQLCKEIGIWDKTVYKLIKWSENN